MMTKILMVMPIVVVAFAGIVALRPSGFRVTRTARMSAPAAAVFAQVNDFHNWEAWNPWGKLDPAMKQTYQRRARRDWRSLHLDWQQRGGRRADDYH